MRHIEIGASVSGRAASGIVRLLCGPRSQLGRAYPRPWAGGGLLGIQQRRAARHGTTTLQQRAGAGMGGLLRRARRGPRYSGLTAGAAAALRMLAYNGSIPGPTLHVDQGSEITVQATNDGDIEATVHWHGLRLENRYDGVPRRHRRRSRSGARSPTRSSSPTPGSIGTTRTCGKTTRRRWGCTAQSSSSPPTRRIGRRRPAADPHAGRPARRGRPHRAVPPVRADVHRHGSVRQRPADQRRDQDFSGDAAQGEVVRLYLVNTANTRIFNFAVRGARMKLVGGDSGRYERETFVDAVLLAPPNERLSTCCSTLGDVRLEHRPGRSTTSAGSRSRLRAGHAAGRSTAARRPNSPPSISVARRRAARRALAFARCSSYGRANGVASALHPAHSAGDARSAL